MNMQTQVFRKTTHTITIYKCPNTITTCHSLSTSHTNTEHPHISSSSTSYTYTFDKTINNSPLQSSSSPMTSTYPRNGSGGEKNGVPPGKPLSFGTQMLDKGAKMLQSLKPIKQMSQHACTFASYSQDMSRQIETHHFITRINQDFLQCAVYDSDDTSGRLIGVEYIVSDRIFDTLPPDEQKLWHSHAYEIQSGLLVHPRVPEMVAKPELENMAKTYGKFWCTWQTDRGDKLPIGPPSLMMSPQEDVIAMAKPELVKKRDDKYNISTAAIRGSRTDITGPTRLNRMADYWREHHKCFAVEVEKTEMKKLTVFP